MSTWSAEAQGIRTQPLPLVWVLATGGTIAGRGASTGVSDYKSGALAAEELVKAVPEITQVAEVKVEQLFNVASGDLTLDNVLALSKRINTIFATDPRVAGIVVTHGTSTLEETAYFLNLTVRDERPVVVTGAMRPATATSADGPLNLLNAVRAASTHEARAKGVLVVLNDEINAAREATKTSTYRVETFRAPDLGLLGYVDGDAVVFYRSSTRRHTSRTEFDVMQMRELPKVDIYYSYSSAERRDHRHSRQDWCQRDCVRRHGRRDGHCCRASGAQGIAGFAGWSRAGTGAFQQSRQWPRHRADWPAGRVRRPWPDPRG